MHTRTGSRVVLSLVVLATSLAATVPAFRGHLSSRAWAAGTVAAPIPASPPSGPPGSIVTLYDAGNRSRPALRSRS
jgi:hypothetical protein